MGKKKKQKQQKQEWWNHGWPVDDRANTRENRHKVPPTSERFAYVEYDPNPGTPMEQMFKKLPAPVRQLINTWLLVLGLFNINEVSEKLVNLTFRTQSLVHHPDRGGSAEMYKELVSVRDHLLTLCEMAQRL